MTSPKSTSPCGSSRKYVLNLRQRKVARSILPSCCEQRHNVSDIKITCLIECNDGAFGRFRHYFWTEIYDRTRTRGARDTIEYPSRSLVRPRIGDVPCTHPMPHLNSSGRLCPAGFPDDLITPLHESVVTTVLCQTLPANGNET